MQVAKLIRLSTFITCTLLCACVYQKKLPEVAQPDSKPEADRQTQATPSPKEKTTPAPTPATTIKPTVEEPQKTAAPEIPVQKKEPEKPAETVKPEIQQTVKTAATPHTTQDKSISTQEKLSTNSLKGKIQIIGKRDKEHRPTNVIITLTPLNQSSNIKPSSRTHNVDMNNKTYLPVAQTIRKGDTLQFNNNDNIKHNVFSSSGNNTFDLGTFKGGSVRSVSMEHSGIVKVYCNIHPEMATFVMVTDYPYHAITDTEGSFEIENIPSGEYELALWHIRGELKKTISINTGLNIENDLTIDASSYRRVAHKNKYGKDYKKKPALFEDEFY